MTEEGTGEEYLILSDEEDDEEETETNDYEEIGWYKVALFSSTPSPQIKYKPI